ncbi:MAG: hypothetical protein ACRCWI_08085 [Brevinema sp.]
MAYINSQKLSSNIVHEIYSKVKTYSKIYIRSQNIVDSVGSRVEIDNEITTFVSTNSNLSCYELCIGIFCIWSERIDNSGISSDNESIQFLWEEIRRKYSILLQEKDKIFTNFSKHYPEARQQLDLYKKSPLSLP